jgi:hypothetical protein
MKTALTISVFLNVLLICMGLSYVSAQNRAQAILVSRLPVEGVLGRPHLRLFGENGYPTQIGWRVTYHLATLTTSEPIIKISLFGGLIDTDIPDMLQDKKINGRER